VLIVIDSSAILAILQDEPERKAFNQIIAAASDCSLSAASLVEISVVLESRFGASGQQNLDLFLCTAGIDVIPFDLKQAELARTAFRRFGKGRHPAGLNLGDCYSYALAQVREAPLLFKGNDFSHTDVRVAYPSS
jgi:ribonuclease VapC